MGRLFCVRFYALVAYAVARRIMWLNGGKWPRSLSQWQRVASRAKYVLLLVRDDPVQDCCLFGERVIVIRVRPDERAMLRAVCHEVAHAILASSGPGYLLDWPTDPEECHYTARLVEEWMDGAVADRQLRLFDDELGEYDARLV